jgi:hypothetical protein
VTDKTHNAKDNKRPGGGPALAWSGDDPVAFSAATAALESAEIPIFPLTEHDQFTVSQISGPQYRIFVPKQQFAAAEKAIAAALAQHRKSNAKE